MDAGGVKSKCSYHNNIY